MAGHHAVIDHDGAVTGLGPDFVIALAGPIERPTVIGEDRLQSLRIALDHSGGDVEVVLVVGDDAQAVRAGQPRRVDKFVGMNRQQVGEDCADLLGESFQGRGVGGEARHVAVGDPPASGLGVVLGADRPQGHVAIVGAIEGMRKRRGALRDSDTA